MTFCIKKVCPQTYVYRSDKKYRIQARNKELYEFIKNLDYPNGNEWNIPPKIVSNPLFRRIWLRAFFDDEGTVGKSDLRCFNTNKKAMLTIKRMLELEGFRTKMTKRLPKNKNHKICYTIRIPVLSSLLFKKIGFDHTIKKEKYREFYKKRMRRTGFEPV